MQISCFYGMRMYLPVLWVLVVCGCDKDSSEVILLLPDHIVAGEILNSPGKSILFTEIEPVPRVLADNFLDLPIHETYQIDINGDGRDDYQLVRSRAFSTDYDSLRIELNPLGDNQIMVMDTQSNWVSAVPILDTIHQNSNWTGRSGILFNTYISKGDTTALGLWRNLSPVHYSGVKTKVDEQWLYGWIRMAVAQSWGDNLVVFDYATTIPLN